MKKDRNSILQTYNNRVENQSNTKKILLIAIIIVLIMIFAIGGTFAYLYLGTDTFLSDEQKFYKYFSQSFETIGNLKDKDLKTYYEKQLNEAYSNNGEISVNISGNLDESTKMVSDEIQKHKITISSDVDYKNNYLYHNISLKYDEKDVISGSLINKDDYLGLRVNDVLKMFFVFENNNLKEFANKLGIADVSNIPDKIDFQKIKNSQKLFTAQEIKELKDRYLKVISDNLSEDMFSNTKEEKTDIFTLTINEDQSKKIAISILDTIENDQLIMNKIKEFYIKENGKTEEEAQSIENEIKNYITQAKQTLSNSNKLNTDTNNNNENTSNKKEQKLYIRTYTSKRKLIKTEYEIDEEGKIIIENIDNGINLNIYTPGSQNSFNTLCSIKIEKNKTDNELLYKISFANGENKGSTILTLSYKGLSGMTNIEEKFSLNDNLLSYFMISGDEAIIEKSKEAQNKSEYSVEKDQIQIALTELLAEVYKDNYVSGEETLYNETTIKEYLSKKSIDATVSKNEDGTYKITVNTTGNSYNADSNGQVTTVEINVDETNTVNEATSEQSNSSESEDKIINISITYTNNKTFGDITHQELKQEDIYKINDKSLEQIENLFDQLGKRTLNKIKESYKGTIIGGLLNQYN